MQIHRADAINCVPTFTDEECRPFRWIVEMQGYKATARRSCLRCVIGYFATAGRSRLQCNHLRLAGGFLYLVLFYTYRIIPLVYQSVLAVDGDFIEKLELVAVDGAGLLHIVDHQRIAVDHAYLAQ